MSHEIRGFTNSPIDCAHMLLLIIILLCVALKRIDACNFVHVKYRLNNYYFDFTCMHSVE